MDDHKIDIHTGSGVGRGTQSIFNPKVKMLKVVSGPLRWVWKLTRGHVNRPDSSTPIGKAEDREGTQPQNIISSPKETIENITDKPQIVSLGPFHPPNETIKDKIVRIKNEDSHFQELVNNIKRHGQSIREWYNDEHECQYPHSDEELGRMMARDGLFLLQFLREISDGAKCPASSFTCSFKDIGVRLSQQPFAVQKDVMKVCNQIPLFVLQKILQWEAQNEWESCMDQDLNSILTHAWSNLCPIQCMSGSPGVRGYWHLLEFVYENIIGRAGATVRRDRENIICCLPKQRKKNRGNSRITLPTAVELKARGVKFDKIEGPFAQIEGPFAQICFDPGNLTLYLPTIEMPGRADVVLRNLVEFEKSKSEEQQPLMSYVNMMDRLVNKADDVEILRNCGIIHTHLGTNDDVASVWDGLMRDILPERIEYGPIDNAVDGVISFYTGECKRWHCSLSWISAGILSAISAGILLCLTVLQTYLAWEQLRLQRESMDKL